MICQSKLPLQHSNKQNMFKIFFIIHSLNVALNVQLEPIIFHENFVMKAYDHFVTVGGSYFVQIW